MPDATTLNLKTSDFSLAKLKIKDVDFTATAADRIADRGNTFVQDVDEATERVKILDSSNADGKLTETLINTLEKLYKDYPLPTDASKLRDISGIQQSTIDTLRDYVDHTTTTDFKKILHTDIFTSEIND